MEEVPSKETSVIPPIEDLKNTLKIHNRTRGDKNSQFQSHTIQRGGYAPSLAKQLKDLRNLCKEHSTDTAQDTSSSSILLDIIIQLIGLNTTVNNLLQLEAPAAEIEEIKNVISNRTVLLTELGNTVLKTTNPRESAERYASVRRRTSDLANSSTAGQHFDGCTSRQTASADTARSNGIDRHRPRNASRTEHQRRS